MSTDTLLSSDLTMRKELIGNEQLLCPVIQGVSSQRAGMGATSLPQAMLHQGVEPPRTATGYEQHFGEFSISKNTRKEDGILLAAIPRFTVGQGSGMITESPTKTVIYHTSEGVDYFDINDYVMTSNGFGYRNTKAIAAAYLANEEGSFIPHDEIYAQSPAFVDGSYCLGTNMNIVFMSLKDCGEDSFVLAKDKAESMMSHGYEKFYATITDDMLMVDLYGDDISVKPIPDIGELVGEDGVLLAMRKKSPKHFADFISGNQSRLLLTSDTVIKTKPGAVVRDIQVYTNHTKFNSLRNSGGVHSQIIKYQSQHYDYYRKVIETYQKARAAGYKITSKFNDLVTRCMQLHNDRRFNGGAKLYNGRVEVQQYVIEITVEHVRKVGAGFKFTGQSGDKGVLSPVLWDPEDMPVDENGIRADLIVCPTTIRNRLTSNQQWEQFFGHMGIIMGQRLKRGEYGTGKAAFETIMDFIHDVRPAYAEALRSTITNNDQMEDFLDDVREDGIYYLIHGFCKHVNTDNVKRIMEKWNYRETPVTFNITTSKGTKKRIVSKLPMCIGPKYMYMLGKLPNKQLSSMEYSYVNQLGIPSKVGVVDSNSMNVTYQHTTSITPNRLGEDEINYLNMTTGSENTSRCMGIRATSIEARYTMGEMLLYNSEPTKLSAIPMSTKDIIKSSVVVDTFKRYMGILGFDVSATSKGRG